MTESEKNDVIIDLIKVGTKGTEGYEVKLTEFNSVLTSRDISHDDINFILQRIGATQENGIVILGYKDIFLYAPICITLSGGGTRAAIYELGILLYLSHIGKLRQTNAIISISGGSILAGHVAINWNEYSADVAHFVNASSKLVAFLRKDIRDRSLVKWMWLGGFISKLVLWLIRNFYNATIAQFTGISIAFANRRVAYLTKCYDELYSGTTFAELPSTPDYPRFFFLACDARRKDRVALSRNGITRIDLAGQESSKDLVAAGISISMAVAASSCFPILFEPIIAKHGDLNLTYGEFMDEISLFDG